MAWNHNLHYHRFVLERVPADCVRVLDVGCGRGGLTHQLARLSREVVGIDADPDCLRHARISHGGQANLSFLDGDILTEPLPSESFNFIVAVATLHHLPLRPALARLRELLQPGGVLAVVGLYRSITPVDYAFSAAALPISWAIRRLRGEEPVGAPLQEPRETLRAIRRTSDSVLPGSEIRRRLFFRYTLAWQKPLSPGER